MADDPRQRSALRSLRNIVCHRVETYVVISTVPPVKGVESPVHAVFLKYAYVAIKLGKANSSGQSGHPGADDSRVVVFFVHVLNRDEKSTDNALQRIRAKLKKWR